jgi:predicted nucleic acid-binding protein
MADSPLFIDTNILVFANVAEAPKHALALGALRQARRTRREMWINRQVLREFLAVRTRPQTFAEAAEVQTVVERVRWFTSHFRVAEESAAVTQKLLELMESYQVGGKQVHDATIVATMLVNGVRHLLTDNPDDFRRFEDQITIETIEVDEALTEQEESPES